MNDKNIKNVKIRDIMLELVKIPEESMMNRCKLTIIDGNKLMIEEYKNIIDFNSNYISIDGKKLEINIIGENLTIQEISKEDLLIQGEISQIYFKKDFGE